MFTALPRSAVPNWIRELFFCDVVSSDSATGHFFSCCKAKLRFTCKAVNHWSKQRCAPLQKVAVVDRFNREAGKCACTPLLAHPSRWKARGALFRCYPPGLWRVRGGGGEAGRGVGGGWKSRIWCTVTEDTANSPLTQGDRNVGVTVNNHPSNM